MDATANTLAPAGTMKYGLFVILCCILADSGFADVINFGNTVFIGDSITEGRQTSPPGGGDRSWRYWFWQNLVDNGDSFDFVGSRTSNWQGNATYPTYNGLTFPNRHEALWGTTSFERATTLAGQYSDLNNDGSNASADTAFIFLGSNDASNPGNALTSIRDQFRTIVDGLQSANADVNIFLISVLPRFINDTDGDGFRDSPFDRNSEFAALNVLLEDLATNETNTTSTVGFIDVASQMTPPLYYDGLHPNTAGEAVVGNFIYSSAASSLATVPEPGQVVLLIVMTSVIGLTMLRKRMSQSRLPERN